MSGPEEPDLESLDFSDEVVSQLLGYARDAEHREEIAAHIEVVRSFKSPAGWAARATRGTSEPFVIPPHISYLNDKLVDLVTGRLVHSVTGEPCSRLMVTMPPRHGKSELCSKYLPAWYLTRFPDRRIILAAYEATFAATWGQAARDLIEEHPWCGVEVRKDARASDDWKLVGHSGRMVTAGIGGPTTGKGATLLIIDDPVKNRDEADSPTFRERNWSWYLSTARTRMQKPHPGSPIKPAVLVIQCMTGDTPVLRPDGTTTALADVRPGDEIATYENGCLATSTVTNWADQGPDEIYEIKMISGTTVRANARHPFLTVNENGAEIWQRTDSLKPGSHILRVTGGGGSGSPVPQTAAIGLSPAKASAPRTTTKHDGLRGSAHPPSTQSLTEPLTSSTDMGSPWATTTPWWKRRGGAAPSAERTPPVAAQPTGAGNSASTTITTPERSELFSATSATSSSKRSSLRPCSAPPLTTWSVTPDEVVSVTHGGVDNVFDLQVERTHNFIANGLVSHNTRWHEDDLAGRILANEKGWEVINFPALAEETDVLGRQIGDPLWPEMYDKETLEETRELDSYTWGALYQQHPTPLDGGTFARENFRYWQYVDAGKAYLLEGTEPHPVKDCVRIVTADLAASTKTRADWTVFSCWDITRTSPPNLILVDRIRRRVETTEHMPMLEEALARWKPRYVGVEKATYGLSLLQAAVRAGLAVRPLIADKDKVSRAMPASDLVRQHRVFFPKHVSWLEEWEHEVLAFPNGTHDDQVDTFAYAGIEVGSHRFAKREKTPDVALPMGERVWAQLERNRKQARRHPTLGSW